LTYHATDDDLPDILREDTPRSAPVPPREDLQRAVAAQVHFPASAPLTRKQQRDLDRDRSESQRDPLGKRKQYVKLGKKVQMYDWLRWLEEYNMSGSGESQFPTMTNWEHEFCESLLARFRKYTVYRVKWVTIKQYNALRQIAEKYLKLPVTK
jgi:hypothetical protein